MLYDWFLSNAVAFEANSSGWVGGYPNHQKSWQEKKIPKSIYSNFQYFNLLKVNLGTLLFASRKSEGTEPSLSDAMFLMVRSKFA